MPLPPAPTKRAAMLSPEAFDAPARSSHKATRKSEAPAMEEALVERPQVQDEFDPRSFGGDVQAEDFDAEVDTVLEQTILEEAPPARRRKDLPVAAPLPKKKKATGHVY